VLALVGKPHAGGCCAAAAMGGSVLPPKALRSLALGRHGEAAAARVVLVRRWSSCRAFQWRMKRQLRRGSAGTAQERPGWFCKGRRGSQGSAQWCSGECCRSEAAEAGDGGDCPAVARGALAGTPRRGVPISVKTGRCSEAREWRGVSFTGRRRRGRRGGPGNGLQVQALSRTGQAAGGVKGRQWKRLSVCALAAAATLAMAGLVMHGVSVGSEGLAAQPRSGRP
jgi:hypothetical protein